MSTSRIPEGQLRYAKGVLSGLLNFSIRSGLIVGDGCERCGAHITDADSDPAKRCRCGYEHALEVAIRCIDEEIARTEEKETAPGGQVREREALKRLTRLINANFGYEDICALVRIKLNVKDRQN